MHPIARVCGAACFGALLTLPTSAKAQGAEPPSGQTDQPAITPPRLIHFAPASRPESRNRQAVRVVLDLTIDEAGTVANAAVAESGGSEFDSVAIEAARAFQFEPARRGSAPIPARIRYAYVFEALEPDPLPALPPAAAPAPPALPVAAPAPREAPPAPLADAALDSYEATASVEAPPRDVTRRSVDSEVIRRLPGTRGDALRAIEVMPGVARTSLESGDPILRGAAQNESRTLLNGTPIPLLYHFGGLTSFLSSRLVSRLDLYPGNFSARYGRVAGGVIEVKTRDPESDRLRLAVDLNLIDSSAFAEAPLGERSNLAVAVRRSNIDFFFENFVPEDAYSVVAAPVYYDYQAFFVHRFSADTRLRVLGYGSRDTLKLFLDDPADEDPAFVGGVSGDLQFHRLAVEVETSAARGLTGTASATIGLWDLEQRIGPLRQMARGPEVFARAELGAELHPRLRLIVGGDYEGLFARGKYYGPRPGGFEGDPHDNDPLGSQRLLAVGEKPVTLNRPGAYAELGFRPVDSLLLSPGARFDYLSELDSWSVDPRIAARYEPVPSTALKAGIGYYTQAPAYWHSLDPVGNPDLDPYRALQTSIGVEQRFGERFKLSVESFYKRLEDVVVATPNRESPYFENTGRGRIFGAEFSSEWRNRGGALFYLAYTLSRSERQDRRGEAYRLFDQDQTHVLSVVGSQPLGAGWEVGARFRLVSGNPVTPITGSVYDARTGLYLPVYGPTSSERDPAFHQLDLRVEKRWTVGPIGLSAYLDVLNMYNATNAEGYEYSFDYSRREAVRGFPFLPNLGVRGEL